ncbi:TonB-dependent receptor plug domain-containing protein [Tahibacter amnicola]|uniref:TonB-dependent receptor n=1 Tax=Tahibacter amnicola TaxID=2976241 RepID=A0ABY6BHL2_9GAMM|nr:TonB-dependent receptor [Tahibacter amnicola]UXI68081.1 TonB-dependent receptor [Tahibacter amnicola]
MRHSPLYLALAVLGCVCLSTPVAFAAAEAQAETAATADASKSKAKDSETQLEAVTVTGSRIPRANIEGPSPVMVITASDIRDKGLTSAYDIVRSLTQSTGSVQTQQFQGFTPGAAQVDLRGLGPNYTLVLLNGRRMADFPLAFNAQSNFTDIANIPVSLIERVEVLSGGASAVYGSDAVSGVVNFILKEKAEYSEVNYRVGDTEDGGGFSQRLQASTGGSVGDFDFLVGVELLKQNPIFQYQRDYQDSLWDDPTLNGRNAIASRTFLRWNPAARTYIDPGQATCDALSDLNFGSVHYAFRPGRGYYCGSTEALYGTVQAERKNAIGYASMTYHLTPDINLYGDFQFARTRAKFGGGPNYWSYTGSPDNTFFNAQTGALESWQRIFTPEEVGGLDAILDYNRDRTASMNVGIEGSLGDWHYDAGYAHSAFHIVQAHRAIVAADADRFFLGQSQGVDDDTGYTIFSPDPTRLYRPLTQAEYNSISRFTPINADTRAESFTLTVDNGELFEMPAGPVGVAAVAEYGTQVYSMRIDPDVLANRYFGWTGTGGAGARSHYAVGAEFRVPLHETLNITPAARYDSYSFGGNTTGKETASLGAEWRPLDSLLVRGSAATSFRAPDLHYLYAGPSGAYYTLTDYYLCRTREPDVPTSECEFDAISVKGTRTGSTNLGNETGRSFTYGFVWSPSSNFDLSVDYYRIELDNAITDRDLDEMLQTEADCRIGQTLGGVAMDINSPTCREVLTLIHRNPDSALVNPGQINGANTYPINASAMLNSGIDASVNYRWETANAGTFKFGLNYTGVLKYTYQQFEGDPTQNIRDDLGYNNLRSRASGSVEWTYGAFSTTLFGQRYGSLPKRNQSGRYGPSATYNLSASYAFNENAKLSVAIDNVRNTPPHRDSTNDRYPYYDMFQFDPIGRQYFVEFSYRFGVVGGK